MRKKDLVRKLESEYKSLENKDLFSMIDARRARASNNEEFDFASDVVVAKMSKNKLAFIIVLIAAVVFCSIFFATYIPAIENPAVYVEFNLNPSVKMVVENDKVVSATASNVDGYILLDETGDLAGASYEDAINKLVEKSTELGYIKQDATEDHIINGNLINLSISGHSPLTLNKMQNRIQKRIDNYFITKGIYGGIKISNKPMQAVQTSARELGMGNGIKFNSKELSKLAKNESVDQNINEYVKAKQKIKNDMLNILTIRINSATTEEINIPEAMLFSDATRRVYYDYLLDSSQYFTWSESDNAVETRGIFLADLFKDVTNKIWDNPKYIFPMIDADFEARDEDIRTVVVNKIISSEFVSFKDDDAKTAYELKIKDEVSISNDTVKKLLLIKIGLGEDTLQKLAAGISLILGGFDKIADLEFANKSKVLNQYSKFMQQEKKKFVREKGVITREAFNAEDYYNWRDQFINYDYNNIR